MKRADTISAIGLLLFLGAMLALTLLRLPRIVSGLREAWEQSGAEQATLLDKAAFAAQEAEGELAPLLNPKSCFVTLNGGAQRLVGRRFVQDVEPGNSVVKLDTGALTFCNLDWAVDGTTPDVSENVRATAELSGWLEGRGIPFLTVAAPHKVSDSEELPAGLSDLGNPAADAFLAGAAEIGVETLDLRPAFDARDDRAALFFRTDHHWRPEGAFLAWQTLARELGARYGFETEERFTDPDSYEWSVLPGLFLGSQGKRVGPLYAGTDDFTVVTPKFSTDLTYETPYETRTGTFNEALCFPRHISQRDWFGGNPYAYYSGGDFALARITNHQNPDGPRVLLIRESFSCALAPFLAQGCSELTTVDLRHLERPLREVIDEEQPDLVLLLYCASSFSNTTLFNW